MKKSNSRPSIHFAAQNAPSLEATDAQARGMISRYTALRAALEMSDANKHGAKLLAKTK